MIQLICTICMIFITILVAEFVIITAKTIYDDFLQKDEIEIDYVKLDAKDWEYLKQQTLKWNDDNDTD